MAFNLQSLFRRNKLVKGYLCEICLIVLCILKAVDMFNIEPVIIYLVYKRDFSCSPMLSKFLRVSHYYHFLIWPLVAQVIFIGCLWQLFRIQKESQGK